MFWRYGYEGTSVGNLTEAMGITPPSLYAAFTDKKGLFYAAVEKYLGGSDTPERWIETTPTARVAVEGLLNGAVIGYTGTDTPAGCLLATAAITGSPESAEVQRHLASIRQAIEASLRQRIERAIRDGESLPPAAMDADAFAGQVMAVIQGLSTLARDGATREKLSRVAGVVLANWRGHDEAA